MRPNFLAVQRQVEVVRWGPGSATPKPAIVYRPGPAQASAKQGCISHTRSRRNLRATHEPHCKVATGVAPENAALAVVD